jgi:hypothetical protein
MSSFENTLERMKNLYTYGKELNESSKSNAYTLEHSSVAADGKTYGIIRECNKYYIKAAQKGRETIAESYEYIGGICNKKHYEYASYNNALKNFELKMASINEACDGNVNISTLDPFKKGDFIVEGTDKMKNEIARQRQIMYNVAMLMNEGTEIGASRKDDVVMNRDANPEAETGKKGDEGMTNATAKPDYAGSKTNGVNKKVAPFAENAPKCEDQLKEACDCGSDNCDCDWASKGLPSTPGVGEADTDHNNEPFTDSVNENEEIDVVDDVEGDDVDFGVDTEDEVDDFDTEDEFDSEDELDTEDDLDMDDELDAEDDLDMDDEFASDEELDVEDDTVGDEQDILAQIEDLQSQIDALRAELGGEEEFDSEKLGDEFDDEELDAELDAEDDFESDELDAEDDFESDELDAEDDFESDEDFENDFESDEDFEDEDEEAIMEAKKQRMNNIVESVVKSILSEDELHDFGKHPGYRKKPMDLPSTGEDKNQWGEDWNDESVHSEEPFGTKIGSSAPFEKVVDAISKHVMSKISEAVKGGKKKVK